MCSAVGQQVVRKGSRKGIGLLWKKEYASFLWWTSSSHSPRRRYASSTASSPMFTWSGARSSTPPKIAPRGCSCSGRGGCASKDHRWTGVYPGYGGGRDGLWGDGFDRPADAGGLRTGYGGLRDLHHAP